MHRCINVIHDNGAKLDAFYLDPINRRHTIGRRHQTLLTFQIVDAKALGFSNGDVVTLAGLTGADAALLNGETDLSVAELAAEVRPALEEMLPGAE